MKDNYEFHFDSRMMLVFSWVFFLVIVAAAVLFFGNDIAIVVDTIILGLVIATLPYALFRFFEFRKVNEYEKQFPNFLRDLAESQRVCLSTIQAIQSLVKSDYGAMTPEIKKVYNQLSWNVPLEKVLKNFARRSKSKIIERSITVIDQVNKSGGNIEDVMDSLATNIEHIRDAMEEKSAVLRQQVIMIYAIFFIFLGISLALLKFLVPMTNMNAGTANLAGLEGIQFGGNPCSPCLGGRDDVACVGCNLFTSVSIGVGFVSQSAVETQDPVANTNAYYRALFFLMVVIQGFCSGLVCGQIGSDSLSAGVKHSLIMVVVGVAAFIITIKAGLV
ncbi:MAG: type II secretion system F family protein [Candidatus Aenigmarchaeota archaeon]|nr:type II secretion system F family protein [Candidatus Aenigmarchaeota archaeon]